MKKQTNKIQKNKQKVQDTDLSEKGRVYLLTNQSRVSCVMWAKNREHLYAEVLDVTPRVSVYVPAEYVVREIPLKHD